MKQVYIYAGGIIYMASRIFCHITAGIDTKELSNIFYLLDILYPFLLILGMSIGGVNRKSMPFIYLILAFSVQEVAYELLYQFGIVPFVSSQISYVFFTTESFFIAIYVIYRFIKNGSISS